jgi:hypothetical protein
MSVQRKRVLYRYRQEASLPVLFGNIPFKKAMSQQEVKAAAKAVAAAPKVVKEYSRIELPVKLAEARDKGKPAAKGKGKPKAKFVRKAAPPPTPFSGVFIVKAPTPAPAPAKAPAAPAIPGFLPGGLSGHFPSL